MIQLKSLETVISDWTRLPRPISVYRNGSNSVNYGFRSKIRSNVLETVLVWMTTIILTIIVKMILHSCRFCSQTIWNLEPDKGFNLFVSSIEKGFPRSDGIDLLNKIVANSIGAEGKDFDINYVFRIKDKSAGDKC